MVLSLFYRTDERGRLASLSCEQATFPLSDATAGLRAGRARSLSSCTSVAQPVLMGCSTSRPADGDSISGKFAGISSDGGVRQSDATGRHASLTGMDAQELQSKLEKLDEERIRVQDELRRLHSTVAMLDGGGETDNSSPLGGAEKSKTRVRFSKYDGLQAEPPPALNDRLDSGLSRRGTSSSAIARLSTYSSVARFSGGKVAKEGSESKRRLEGLPPNEKDIKSLSDMVVRGRKRTRHTHRSSTSPIENGVEAESSTSNRKVSYLPRGGVHVTTKYGAVQFGMPPETIKDSMQLGLEVPGIFVVPKDRFNLKYGTNTAEIEFPGYWNFFIKGRSTTLVCSSEAASILTRVVDETLEGVRAQPPRLRCAALTSSPPPSSRGSPGTLPSFCSPRVCLCSRRRSSSTWTMSTPPLSTRRPLRRDLTI